MKETQPDRWACEAYGPDGASFGAVCFFSREPGQRVCVDQNECHQAMAAERKRVFRRIHELAASGDETGTYLAGEFSSPEQLLGGKQDEGRKRRGKRRR